MLWRECQFFICASAEVFGWAIVCRGATWKIKTICFVMKSFITCCADSRIYSYPLRIFYNGPAVWWVGVRVEVPCFLPVLVDGRELSCHDKVIYVVPSPNRWSRVVMSWWNSPDGEQKTRHQCVGRQPYWLCLGSRNSPGGTRFNKWVKFSPHRLLGPIEK